MVLLVTLCHFRHVMWSLLPTSNDPMCRAQIKITPFIYMSICSGIFISNWYPWYPLSKIWSNHFFCSGVSNWYQTDNQTNTQQGLSLGLSQKLHTEQHFCSQACRRKYSNIVDTLVFEHLLQQAWHLKLVALPGPSQTPFLPVLGRRRSSPEMLWPPSAQWRETSRTKEKRRRWTKFMFFLSCLVNAAINNWAELNDGS